MRFVWTRLLVTVVRGCICLSLLLHVCWTQGYPYDHFTRTPGSYLPGHDDRTMFHTSLEDCLTACLQETDFLCKSVDIVKGKCQLSKVTAADAFGGVLGKNPASTYYERRQDTSVSAVSATPASAVPATPDTPSTPAVIRCPDNITHLTETGQAYALVTWPTPMISHEGFSSLTASHLPGTTFHIGDTKVVYTSSDSKDNTLVCDFFVIVKDEEPPGISHCPKPISKLTNGDNASVSWEGPTANDNSGSAQLSASHRPGDRFQVGTTTVTYQAQDEAGNRAECSFMVLVTKIQDSNFLSLHLILQNITNVDAFQNRSSKEYQRMTSKIEQDLTSTFNEDETFLGVTVQIRSIKDDISADVKIGFSEDISSHTDQHRLNLVLEAAHDGKLRNVAVLKLPQPDGNLEILDACFVSPCPTPMNCSARGLQCIATCADNAAYCMNGAVCQSNDTNYITCKCKSDKLLQKYSGERCDSTRMALSVKQLSILGVGGAWLLVLILTVTACIALAKQRRTHRKKCEITSTEHGHYLRTLPELHRPISPVTSEDVGYSSRGDETSPNESNIMVPASQQGGGKTESNQASQGCGGTVMSGVESPQRTSVSSGSSFSDFQEKSSTSSDSGTEVIRFGQRGASAAVIKQETTSLPSPTDSQMAVRVDIEKSPSISPDLPCTYDGEIPDPIYQNNVLIGQSVPAEAETTPALPHLTHSFDGVVPDPLVEFNSGETFPCVDSSQTDGGNMLTKSLGDAEHSRSKALHKQYYFKDNDISIDIHYV